MLDAGALAPDVSLTGLDGEQIQLSQAWRDAPALLVLLRHLGCMFCKQQVVDLRNRQGQLRELNLNVVLVAQAEPPAAKEFVEKYEVPFAMYCDPALATYDAFRLGKTDGMAVLRPGLYIAAAAAMAGGHLNRAATAGDARQMPGLFLVGQDGRIVYAHHFSHAGDQPSTARLLRLLPELLMERR